MQALSIYSDDTKRQRQLNDALFRAINDEYWPRVKELLDEGASPNARQDGSPLNALHTAVHYNASERITRMLLENGAEITSRSVGNAYTPLHVAARMDKRAHIRTLMEFGADLHARDGKGNTPLHTAIAHGKLHAAAQLVSLGASLTEQNNDGAPPLDAAEEGLEGMKGYDALMDAISRRHARRLQHAHYNRPKGP